MAAHRLPVVGLLAVPALACAQFSFVEVASFPAGPGPSGVAVADFDEDGRPDLVAANDGVPTVSVLIAEPGLRFAPPVAYPTEGGSRAGHRAQPIATGDFNGDGHIDFAVTNQYGSFFVSVFLGTGDGTFLPEAIYSTGTCPVSVIAADVDGDDTLDLVTANFEDDSVSVLIGAGDGSFLPRADIPSPQRATAIITADFDSDGHPDLAMTNLDPPALIVHRGLGSAGFGPPVSYPLDGGPWSATVGDFNRDGHPDIATANQWGRSVSVLLGFGDGTFESAVAYPVPDIPGYLAKPNSIVSADLDHDGNLDLAVADHDGGAVDLFHGNADGTFQLAQIVRVGSSTSTVAATDFNRDGRMDIAALDYYWDTVSLLLAAEIFAGAIE